jgi:excisionase family DNA binding protein
LLNLPVGDSGPRAESSSLWRSLVEKLQTVTELADKLRVKPSTIYTWVRQDKVPYIRLGRLIRFTSEQVDKLLDQNNHEESLDDERWKHEHRHKDEQEAKDQLPCL